jgi:hypothetical protein
MLFIFWRDHSLTIILTAVGAILTGIAFMYEEGKLFDLWLSLGAGTLTVALFYFLAQFLREKAKPED